MFLDWLWLFPSNHTFLLTSKGEWGQLSRNNCRLLNSSAKFFKKLGWVSAIRQFSYYLLLLFLLFLIIILIIFDKIFCLMKA